MQEAAAVIGEKLFPVFESISKVVLKVVNAFSRLPDGVQENIIKFGLLAAAAGPLLYAYGTLKIAMGALIGASASLVGSFTTLFVVQSGGLKIGKALSVAFKALAATTSLLSFSFNTAISRGTNLFGALSRLKLIVSAVSAQSAFLAGGAIRQLGRSFLFLAGVPIKSLSIGLFRLGRSLVGYGNGLAITTALNNAHTKVSFNKLASAVSGLGSKIAFLVKNPLKALRLGFLAIGGALSSITIPFGLVAAGIAAFGVAVALNIGPARKKFVELVNTFIDLYNESTAFQLQYHCFLETHVQDDNSNVP